MKPIKFKQQNVTFAENQKEYLPLPALKLNTPQGQIISCWKLSFKDKLKILFIGKIWLNIMSFNKPLMPCYISTNRKDVFSLENDNIPLYKKIALFILKIF